MKDIPQVEEQILDHAYVQYLLKLLAELSEKLSAQDKRIEDLEAEISRLKKLPKKPKVKPSKLDEENSLSSDEEKAEKPSAWSKGSKKDKLEIHEHKDIKPDDVPSDWVLVGHECHVRQDMLVRANNIEYRLEIWRSPDGQQEKKGLLPSHLQDTHFGGTLKSYILHQYYECGVTQPLILSSLRDFGIVISSGQISAILTGDHEAFHEEKCDLLLKAIEMGGELRTDDTGARHGFKNASCNCINNDLFTYFSTTGSKSRINFLDILRCGKEDYHLNDAAFSYMEDRGLPEGYLSILQSSFDSGAKHFVNEANLDDYLELHSISAKHAVKTIKEALMVGCLVEYGLGEDTLIHSDGAGQFNLFHHSLCWKHAERPLVKLKCYNPFQEQQWEEKKRAFWTLYQKLKAYKDTPTEEQASLLYREFDELCVEFPYFSALNQVLERLRDKKDQLLLVLQRPETSLHNNDSERDIREYVKRRKISAGTRSENGRKSRDTFLSIKKTCRKLGISFWEYLQDRIMGLNGILPLATIMEQKAAAS